MRHWLDAATHAASPDTRLFVKLIAERDSRQELGLLGLAQPAWGALLARHFAQAHPRSALPPTLRADSHADSHAAFVRALHALLLAHANPALPKDDADCLATIIAQACLRPDHLWRDLGLAGRDEVTWMLTRYFPTLVALNTSNLRWKKFLAQQLALSLGLQPGPAPGCPGCEDYAHCFPR
ncbi:nitrogen fixation protein NifQ [Paraburkholderia sp. BCC1884]|uniref:nitrogen fixation protein NifQ n=1 Tax=Paraburkholderia sp. BCC1884 TaxID=2562668 RepID=UPI0011840B96|nr:nitrogen fixation protein NifQ [Paraburkholderia sp. BCC1884]